MNLNTKMSSVTELMIIRQKKDLLEGLCYRLEGFTKSPQWGL